MLIVIGFPANKFGQFKLPTRNTAIPSFNASSSTSSSTCLQQRSINNVFRTVENYDNNQIRKRNTSSIAIATATATSAATSAAVAAAASSSSSFWSPNSLDASASKFRRVAVVDHEPTAVNKQCLAHIITSTITKTKTNDKSTQTEQIVQPTSAYETKPLSRPHSAETITLIRLIPEQSPTIIKIVEQPTTRTSKDSLDFEVNDDYVNDNYTSYTNSSLPLNDASFSLVSAIENDAFRAENSASNHSPVPTVSATNEGTLANSLVSPCYSGDAEEDELSDKGTGHNLVFSFQNFFKQIKKKNLLVLFRFIFFFFQSFVSRKSG